jgi:phosphate transport system permease protein
VSTVPLDSAAGLDYGRPLTPSGNLRRRLIVSRLAEGAATAAAVLAVGVLGILVFAVIQHGAGVLSLGFLFDDLPASGAAGGGIGPAILGTGMLVLGATVISAPIGILVALYTHEFSGPRTARLIRLALDLLNGLPSIVVGLFIFGLLVYGNHQSGFAGSVGLSIIMLPLVARSAQEVLALVPQSLSDAADALGISRWRTVVGVILPAALTGIVTGTILAVARAAGETAPLLLTCSLGGTTATFDYFGQALPNIPLFIFSASESADPSGFTRAWGASFVLLMFILFSGMSARFLLARSRGQQ